MRYKKKERCEKHIAFCHAIQPISAILSRNFEHLLPTRDLSGTTHYLLQRGESLKDILIEGRVSVFILLSYFFVKKIPLSQRVGYVMGG